VRKGPLSVTVLLSDPSSRTPDPSSAAIAWAIPRRVGVAVTRNRVRRRLRAVLADEHRSLPLPSGTYVFHVDPPAVGLSFGELSVAMHDLLSVVRTSVTP
jgi:ribonuclease P protein component